MVPLNWDTLCIFISEIIGTALLVLLGCMGCVNTDVFENSLLQSAFNFGMVVMLVIQAIGCVSGAHINPSITIAAYIYEKISATMAIVYFTAQMLGGTLGYLLLRFLLPSNFFGPNFCVTLPYPEVGDIKALLIEFVVTAVLILFTCGVWDPRNKNYQDSVSIRFGLTIFSLSVTAAPFTGCSMNTARSFGPALVAMNFSSHWVYWVGPNLGAASAAYFYKMILKSEEIEDEIYES